MDVTAKTLNARNSAIQLIRGLGEEDRVAVYAFDRDLYRLTDFTKSKEDAVAALTRIEPFGSTALYDAVVTLSGHVVDEGFGRRAIVVVTDGVDTFSDATVELAVEKAKGVDLPVYVIRVLSPVDDPESDLFLGVHGASFRGEDALRRFTSRRRPVGRCTRAANGASSSSRRPAFVRSSKRNIELDTSPNKIVETANFAASMFKRAGGGSRFGLVRVITRRLARRPTALEIN